MLRVRGLTMDDAHIFLEPEKEAIEKESFELLDIVEFRARQDVWTVITAWISPRGPRKKLAANALLGCC